MSILSEIKDEHAIEIAKIAARRPDHFSIEDADITRYKNSIDIVFVDKIDEVINIAFNGDVLLYRQVDINHKVIEERVYNQVKIVDTYRKLGYDL